MRVRAGGTAFFLAALCAGALSAELYQWTDEKGVVHIEKSPPEDAQPARRVKVFGARKRTAREPRFSPGASPTEAKKDPLPFLAGGASRAQSVELYTTSWCPYCVKARNFFLSKSVPFNEYDVEKDASAARRMASLNPSGGVPFTVINGRPIRGYSEKAFEQALSNP